MGRFFGFSVALIERRNTKSSFNSYKWDPVFFDTWVFNFTNTYFNTPFSADKTGMCFSTAALVEFGTNSSIGFPSKLLQVVLPMSQQLFDFQANIKFIVIPPFNLKSKYTYIITINYLFFKHNALYFPI